MGYYKDSEGNWAKEISFSDIKPRRKDEDDQWIPFEETLSKKNSVFYHESLTEEEIESEKKKLAFLRLAIGSLTLKQREVIVLAFNHHKNNREIAVILKISESAVAQRKVQALKKLRKILMGK